MREEILCPCTATLLSTNNLKDGDFVQEGTEVAVLESCKMMIPIDTGSTGKIRYNFTVGQMVPADEVLAEIQIENVN
jgi:biotin carboxyl carrier protein